MGPNVKFVSAITDAFSNKKNGGQFFSAKKTKPGGGGGVRGRFGKRPHFSPFFDTFPYFINCRVIFLADRGPYWVPFPKCGVLEMVHNNRYSVLNQDS